MLRNLYRLTNHLLGSCVVAGLAVGRWGIGVDLRANRNVGVLVPHLILELRPLYVDAFFRGPRLFWLGPLAARRHHRPL